MIKLPRHPLEALGLPVGLGPTGGRLLARVAVQHRAGYVLHDGCGTYKAQPAAEFLRRGLDPMQRPLVGDFVEVEAGSPPHIVRILPRRTLLVRAAAGETYARQAMVANVDSALVLMGMDGDYNPRRIRRYLALIEGSGVQPLVVLTKADQVCDADVRCQTLSVALAGEVPVYAINAKDPAAGHILAQWLLPGQTLVLVGSSGAGKSTLVNTLLGSLQQSTGAVRARDSRGRHITTSRALLALPGGACLIDTPGMRELKLTGAENLAQFDDIEMLVARCRFADCGHVSEPGCAVQNALRNAELDENRWLDYCKLSLECAQQAAQFKEILRRKNRKPADKRHRGRQRREH